MNTFTFLMYLENIVSLSFSVPGKKLHTVTKKKDYLRLYYGFTITELKY